MYRLVAQDLAKRFGPLKVFSDLSFELATGDSVAVTGANGSGKSTLMLLLLQHYRPSRGAVIALGDGRPLSEAEFRDRTSLVAPYLNLYDHLTGEENIRFFATVSGGYVTGKQVDVLLARVGLSGRGQDFVAGYSSGMKQRLKYAVALQSQPDFLFLDEPSSNLDEAGKAMVEEVIAEANKRAVVVIATNEQKELALARQQIRLGE